MNEPIDDTPEPVPFESTWHPENRVEVPTLHCPDCYSTLEAHYVVRDNPSTWLLWCPLHNAYFEYRWVQ